MIASYCCEVLLIINLYLYQVCSKIAFFVQNLFKKSIKMTINCKGNLIDLSTPKIMGILNVTPDSFYDGGNFSSDAVILKQVEKMLNDGADFVDIGGQTTKPTANLIPVDEELKRVVPVVNL